MERGGAGEQSEESLKALLRLRNKTVLKKTTSSGYPTGLGRFELVPIHKDASEHDEM